MNRNSSGHIVCTVGTGTAGPDSFVAHGILAGILHAAPDHAWLCPSLSAESLEVAEYVVSELYEAVPDTEIHMEKLSDHDDLDQCRRELRGLLRRVRQEFPEARIVLNPTSGTKQMTTAAVLAGIDENIADIEYVTGERRDGVVKTGSERVIRVNVRRIYARQTAGNALALVQSGAYRGAERILEPYADLFPNFLALTRCAGFWHRFAYRRALQAAPAGGAFAVLRRPLDVLANSPVISLERAADMIAFTERSLEFGQSEEALAALYRLAELLAKVRLSELGVDPTCLRLEQVEKKLHLSKSLHNKLASMQRHGSNVLVGLALALELLASDPCPLHSRLYADKLTWCLLQERQNTRYGHGVEFVDSTRVRELSRRVLAAATAQWPEFPAKVAACRFPDLAALIEEELTHA